MVRVEVKNKFEVGDEVEIVSPQGIKIVKVEEIYKTGLNHGVEKT